jgi:hypothetical protein
MGDGGCDGGWGMRDWNLKLKRKSTGENDPFMVSER